MKANSLETVIGALILVIAAVFLIYSAQMGGAEKVKGYVINARFNQVGTLAAGDPVKVGGVKIGVVEKITLTKENYLANVSARIDENVKLPVDSSATVASSGLLGGNYLDVSPGGDELMLANDGLLEYTQDAQNLEKLLGQFIFSVQDSKKGGDAATTDEAPAGELDAAPSAAAEPTSAPEAAPAAEEPVSAVPTPEEIDATEPAAPAADEQQAPADTAL